MKKIRQLFTDWRLCWARVLIGDDAFVANVEIDGTVYPKAKARYCLLINSKINSMVGVSMTRFMRPGQQCTLVSIGSTLGPERSAKPAWVDTYKGVLRGGGGGGGDSWPPSKYSGEVK